MIYYYYTHIIAKSIYTMKLSMYEYTLFIPLYLEPSLVPRSQFFF